MDSSLITKVLEYSPLILMLIGLGRWTFSLKEDIKYAHERLDDLEARHTKLEDKIDISMKEINRRIDDCKDSILKNLQVILQTISKP